MTQKFEYFGKYILLEKLATGGMAEVFLARKTGADGIGKFCAIKRILPQFAESPEFIDMFRDEAKIAINLSHSNIVSLHEFGVEKDQFFIVMDYVEGRNLRQILNKMKKSSSKFSIDQIVYIVKEIAGGLDHAHRCLDGTTGKPLNITHRDMSPQNVMVSFEGEIKIVDFGIAKAESQMETTRAGTLKGKFGYMSPEQAEGQPVDLRTDIFSLGIVLWELLANDRLFIANNEINTLRKIRDCQIPSLRKINPNIQSELDRIVQKALARDRNLRYQTAAALHRDLSRFINRQYPDFSPHDFSVFTKTLFADEILNTRKRIIEYSKIPFRDQESRTAKPAKEEDHDTMISGTQTSSFVSVKQQAKSKVPDGPPTGMKNKHAQGSTHEPAEDVEASLDINSVSRSEAQAPPAAPQPTASPFARHPDTPIVGKPQESNDEDEQAKTELSNSAIGVLDEQAIEKESKRKIVVKPSTPYALETEEISPMDRSRTGTGYHQTKGQWSRPSYAAPKRSPINFLSLFVFVMMTVSSYAIAIKFMAGTMRPLVASLDPYIGPFHKALGVTPSTEEIALGSNNSTPNEENNGQAPNPGDPNLPQNPTDGNLNAGTNEPATVKPSDTEAPVAPPTETKEPELKGSAFGQSEMVISSSPSGAEIYINGKNTQSVTPSRVIVPATGNFSLELKRSGFIDYVKEDMNLSNSGLKFTATLQKAMIGYVDIDVRPPKDAKVYINGKLLAEERLPIRGYPVPANTRIKISATNPYRKWNDQRTISVTPEQRTSVILNLRNSGRQPSQR